LEARRQFLGLVDRPPKHLASVAAAADLLNGIAGYPLCASAIAIKRQKEKWRREEQDKHPKERQGARCEIRLAGEGRKEKNGTYDWRCQDSRLHKVLNGDNNCGLNILFCCWN